MAKPWPGPDLDASRSAREQARALLAVRIDEMWSWSPHVEHPERVEELHALRISVKRLRYCIEFLAPGTPPERKAVLGTLVELQDRLGAIHDCDVWADLLRRELRAELKRLRRDQRTLARLPGAADPDLAAAAAEYGRDLQRGPAAGLVTLLRRAAEHRRTLHTDLAQLWRALQEEDFRSRTLALTTKVPGTIVQASVTKP